MTPLILGKAASADVLDQGDGTVAKAFWRQAQAGSNADPYNEDMLTTERFDAETRAYEALSRLPELAVYAPRFFERVDPCALVGEQDTYVKGCSIRLERIHSEAVKVASLPIKDREELTEPAERIT